MTTSYYFHLHPANIFEGLAYIGNLAMQDCDGDTSRIQSIRIDKHEDHPYKFNIVIEVDECEKEKG